MKELQPGDRIDLFYVSCQIPPKATWQTTLGKDQHFPNVLASLNVIASTNIIIGHHPNDTNEVVEIVRGTPARTIPQLLADGTILPNGPARSTL